MSCPSLPLARSCAKTSKPKSTTNSNAPERHSGVRYGHRIWNQTAGRDDDGHHDDDGDSYITCEIGFNDKHTQTNKQQLFRIDISIKWLNLSTYLPRIQPSTSNINARHLVNDRDVPRTNTEKPVIRIYNKIIVIDIQRSIMILDQIFIIKYRSHYITT